MYSGRLQVVLFVRDPVASADYYQRVLGFTLSGFWSPSAQRYVHHWPASEPPEHAELLAGDNRIVLQSLDDRERRGKAEYVLEVEDLDLIFRRARANGGRVEDPWVHVTGSRTFMLTDPDDHVWRLVQLRRCATTG